MTHRSLAVMFSALLLAPAAGLAQDDPAATVERSNQFALENFDLGDVEAAKKKLVEALAQLEAFGLGNKPVAARTHMLMGMVYAQGLGDAGRGLKHFVRALELDDKAELDGHGNDATKALWAQAQQAVNPVVDCATLEGIAHKRVVSTEAGKATPVRLKLAVALHGGAVELNYKNQGAADFTTLAMTKEGDCDFVASVPAGAVTVPSFQYFVVARTAAGKTAAASGSATRPILVEVTQVAPAEEQKVEMRRQEEEVPTELQAGKGKGSGCGGCAGTGGPATGLAGAGLVLAALLVRRRRAS